MQAILKTSSPVSSFIPFVEACCEAVGWVCASSIPQEQKRKKTATRSDEANFMWRRIQQNLEALRAQFRARCVQRKWKSFSKISIQTRTFLIAETSEFNV